MISFLQGEKLYSCQNCKQECGQVGGLKTHVLIHRCEKQSYGRYCGKHCFETWKNSYRYCDVSDATELQAKGSFHVFLKSDVFITNITSIRGFSSVKHFMMLSLKMIHELFITKAASKSFFFYVFLNFSHKQLILYVYWVWSLM